MDSENNKLGIKDWAKEDRPREKMLLKGSSNLSNAELLAILIGSGNRTESAVDVSKRILNRFSNNLNTLGKTSIVELCKIKGIGNAKAISIMAALELGRRQKQHDSEKQQITCSKDCFEALYPQLSNLNHEEFWCLFLNRANMIIATEKISQGGISGTITDIKIIAKKAIEYLATSIIVSHNHPSGNLTPSSEDKAVTNKIKKACETLDINLLDHLIISDQKYYSFADEGIL